MCSYDTKACPGNDKQAEKSQEQHLKRIAAFNAKEIKMFWDNVEKLVECKQNTKLEEKRKKVLDQQLSFIVDQTEKYSMQLAEGMNKPYTSKATSLNSSRISSPIPKAGGFDFDRMRHLMTMKKLLHRQKLK